MTFLLGGYNNDDRSVHLFKNEKWINLKPFDRNLIFGCATFIPKNDSKVYILGGLSNMNLHRNVWKYDLENKSYERLNTKMPAPKNGLKSLACVGIRTELNKEVIQIGDLSKAHQALQIFLLKLGCLVSFMHFWFG